VPDRGFARYFFAAQQNGVLQYQPEVFLRIFLSERVNLARGLPIPMHAFGPTFLPALLP
jgi:hypothetical protein